MRTLIAKDNGINWYQKREVVISGKIYQILDVEWRALENKWYLLVK